MTLLLLERTLTISPFGILTELSDCIDLDFAHLVAALSLEAGPQRNN